MNKAIASCNSSEDNSFQHHIQEFMQNAEPTSDGAFLDSDSINSESNMNIDSELDGINEYPPHSSSNSPFVEVYPGAGQTFGRGETFLDVFDADCHAEKRIQHLYYPFASKAEWSLAAFLLRSDLSMNSIDKFLKLELVSGSYENVITKLVLTQIIIPDHNPWPFILICKRSSQPC